MIGCRWSTRRTLQWLMLMLKLTSLLVIRSGPYGYWTMAMEVSQSMKKHQSSLKKLFLPFISYTLFLYVYINPFNYGRNEYFLNFFLQLLVFRSTLYLWSWSSTYYNLYNANANRLHVCANKEEEIFFAKTYRTTMSVCPTRNGQGQDEPSGRTYSSLAVPPVQLFRNIFLSTKETI